MSTYFWHVFGSFMVPLKTPHICLNARTSRADTISRPCTCTNDRKQDSNGYESIHKHFTNAEGPQQKELRSAIGQPSTLILPSHFLNLLSSGNDVVALRPGGSPHGYKVRVRLYFPKMFFKRTNALAYIPRPPNDAQM